jgi:diguanylate cyclase (GGDEF)-like protein/PAS domain S-box-containing protein
MNGYAEFASVAQQLGSPRTEMRLVRHAWWLYLLLIAPLTVAFLTGSLGSGPTYNVIGFSGVVAMVVGVRLNRPASRVGWYLLAVGQLLFVGGDVLAYNYAALFGVALPSVSVADVLYLSCYPVTGVGLLVLIRRSNPGRDWASLLDSAIVTIGVGVLSWVFLIAPLAHNAALPLGTKLVAIAYPLSDVLILGLAVRMAVSTRRRGASYYLVIGALVAVLAANSGYGWSLLHSVGGVGTLLTAGWIAAHLLFGAAALHPSMATMSQSAVQKGKLTPARIVMIAAATLIAPVTIVVRSSTAGSSEDVVVGGAAVVIFALVVMRMVGLARDSAALGEGVARIESEMRLSALVQHSTDVILVLAPDTLVEYVSPSVLAIFGYAPADLLGDRMLDYLAPEDQAHFEPALAALLAHASPSSEAFEFRIRHRDGRLVHTECRITNLLSNAVVGGVVVNLRNITERKQFEEQLTYQAFHDPGTRLANRALFHDRVEHALNRRRDTSEMLAVLFLDLDAFKNVNDTFGHLAGDGVLATIAMRLRSALRAGDTVARMGGDEFAVLLEDVIDETAVSAIVEKLLEAIAAPLSLDGREVIIQCSVGIAVAGSADDGVPLTVEALVRDADVAMYQAKAAAGHTYRHFKPEMHEAIIKQLALRADLKAAIAAEGLTVAYQPIFDVASGRIAGYEALLRWEHGARGSVSPATFIPAAEESGLIIPLGRWVLNRACSDAMSLPADEPLAPPRSVSVNISARQLARVEIVDEVRDALHSSGLHPHRLVLEITESVMINDLERATERLGALRELGVQIAVDDFGTGYSSLSYLSQLPIDILKIDKRFIDSVDADDKDGRLTTAIIGLARVLELRCVAEGVERHAQLERLKDLGCDYAQGFLLARPMNADALRELLTTPKPTLLAAA